MTTPARWPAWASADVQRAVEEATREVAAFTATAGREALVILDARDGRRLWDAEGDARSVAAPDVAHRWPGVPVVTVHNHPSPRDLPPSYADVALATKEDAALTVIVAARSVFLFGRPAQGWGVALAGRPEVMQRLRRLGEPGAEDVDPEAFWDEMARAFVLGGVPHARVPRSLSPTARWVAGPRGVARAWPC